jgi:dUTP pyrophosphatase
MIRMEVQKMSPDAQVPSKVRTTDAGYDLYSIEQKTLAPHQATIIRTGIKISAPPGYYYTIEGRSSLWSIGIFPNRGVIDATFCGEIVVSLVNVNEAPYTVNIGDRIAQILIHEQHSAYFDIVEEFGAEYNSRGLNGFGSSGK